ncbi:MAG: Stp1/IreP family PP2C-type Ser/Thr phosphatase [Bdellovibrionia bacterium]
MQFTVGIGTDIGRKRSQNQDNSAAHPELGLFIVSDGMGGHQGGETASAIAVETITNSVRKAQQKKNWNPGETIKRAIETASQAVYERALLEPKLNGMGTTTTALLFYKNKVTIGHVGDSRCYFLRPEALWQATRDHSLVQEKLRAGLITRAQLKTDKMKNVITRSVGFEKNVDVELYEMEISKGDCFLLCSDGLSGLIEDEEICKIAQRDVFEAGNIQKAVTEMISAANANGGDDNITTIIVQVN